MFCRDFGLWRGKGRREEDGKSVEDGEMKHKEDQNSGSEAGGRGGSLGR